MINLHIIHNPWETTLIDPLYEVSDLQPSKVRPRHHLFTHACAHRRLLRRCSSHPSKELVAELAVPYPDRLGLIRSWLAYYGISPASVSATHSGSWLTVADVPVSRSNAPGASYKPY